MLLNPIISNETGSKDLFSINLENRIVLLTGEIEDDMAASVISQLLYLDNTAQEKITMYINSPGGSVSAGLAIYDTMKLIKSPVSTVCVGHAASMGAVILSGGSKGQRLILPHAEVMIHQPSGGIEGQSSDMLIAAEHIRRRWCRSCLSGPKEAFSLWMRRGSSLTKTPVAFWRRQ
jgi:ATP-dependent Clp protease protease subunit